MNKVIDEILVEATILGMLSEAMTYDEFLDKAPNITKKGIGPKSGTSEISIRTALGYKSQDFKNKSGEKDTTRADAYAQALTYLHGGVNTGDITRKQIPSDIRGDVESKTPDRGDDSATKSHKPDKEKDTARADQSTDDSDLEKVGDDQPQKDTDKEKDKDTDGGRMIGDKDKTLRDVDSTATEEFQRELEPSDEEFEKRNKKYANPIPPPAFTTPEGLLDNPNFPKKYVKALERIINTRPDGEAKKWGHYSEIPGGAGRIQAQAGELMTMMGASMSDEDFALFTDAIENHVSELIKNNDSLKPDSQRTVSKSWIKSARNNRQAILNRIKQEYPDAEIVATSWDTKDDVESLGLDDYDKNKGFSTDMYMKIRTADGDVLDEISLKKDVNVNFLNSGTGKFMEWDENLPDEINSQVYTRQQRERLAKVGNKLKDQIEELINQKPSNSDSLELKALRKLMKSKKIDFADALQDTIDGKGSRNKSNIVQASLSALSAAGNGPAKEFTEEVDRAHKDFNENAIKAIVTNKKLKEGMLKEIRSEFPLKAVGEGEETMAIGDLSLDRATMREIFGTDDFDTIKQRLSAEPGPPPYLSYKAGPKGNVIPLAEIVVREDGVGYGGQFKFEMTLDKRFAVKLREANEAVYGGSKNESVVYDHIQTLLEMARQV